MLSVASAPHTSVLAWYEVGIAMNLPYKVTCLWVNSTYSTTKEDTYKNALAYAQCYIRTHSTKDRRPEWRYTITHLKTGKTWRGRA